MATRHQFIIHHQLSLCLFSRTAPHHRNLWLWLWSGYPRSVLWMCLLIEFLPCGCGCLLACKAGLISCTLCCRRELSCTVSPRFLAPAAVEKMMPTAGVMLVGSTFNCGGASHRKRINNHKNLNPPAAPSRELKYKGLILYDGGRSPRQGSPMGRNVKPHFNGRNKLCGRRFWVVRCPWSF